MSHVYVKAKIKYQYNDPILTVHKLEFSQSYNTYLQSARIFEAAKLYNSDKTQKYLPVQYKYT